ncbi:MAG: prolyl oligopeptidase family serine peptidase [Candidatus Dormibacteraceae bacterium]
MTPENQHGFGQHDLDRMRFVEAADLSPDGKLAVYVQFTTDPEADRDHCALWLVDVATRETRRLTAGSGKDTSPAFSPDGRQVAFLSDRSGRNQVHVISLDGGEARQVTTFEQGVGGAPEWSPDGRLLAFSAGPQGPPRDPSKPYRITRAIYRFDAVGYLDDVKQDLYVVPAEGGEARQLTDDGRMNSNPRWTPDGRGLVYTGGFEPSDTFFWPQVRHVDLEGSCRDLAHPAGAVAAVDFAPDGRLAILLGFHTGRPVGSKSELYISDPRLTSFECRTTTLSGQVGGGFQGDTPNAPAVPRIRFLADGRAALPVQRGGGAPLFAIALSGPEAFEQLTLESSQALAFATAGDRVVFRSSDFDEPGDLHLWERGGGAGRTIRLTDLNADVLSHVELPQVHEIAARGADGQPVEGWFLEPRGGSAPHPTVLYIHGGPHGAFGHDFHADMQLLAGAGYGVLLANHRASTGYGDAFANQVIGDWGNHDYRDLMAAVDRAVELGLSDPDRLGVCGLSGGGNLTCWIVGQTDRFKAAVPENPVTNFVSMFGVQDLGLWFAQAEAGGPPHEIPETYARMSPITYAHRCTTPTLLVQGEADKRCPPEQSEQFYAALTLAGCPVEMLRLPEMPHAGAIHGPLPVRRAQNEALVQWMDRWLLGKEAVEPESS